MVTIANIFILILIVGAIWLGVAAFARKRLAKREAAENRRATPVREPASRG